MLKALLFILFIGSFTTYLQALEISIQGAKENHKDYSVLHIDDKNEFLCEEEKNDFEEVVKIVCAFSKSPSQELNKIQNNFFEITTQTKRKTFFLIIKPFFKMKLFPMVFDLTRDDTIFNSDVKMSKEWMIVGYSDNIPYIKDNEYPDVSINFPFTLSKDKLPYVGSLDMQGNPVHIKRVRDVTDYIKIKKLYNEKNYDYCLDLINNVIENYPDSLFMAEFLFYKIRVNSKINNYDDVIDAAKIYLRDHSSDDNVPEVLSLIAKAYFKTGINTDADYFFDRLFLEHPNSVYAQWGNIYKGEMYESTASYSKAINLYNKALSNTDDIDVAVSAAFKLAKNYIAIAQSDSANEYIQKIAKAQPEYFKNNLYDSTEMMYELADNEKYIPAATIAEALYNSMDINYNEYEGLLRDRAIWLSRTDKKQDALKALNIYIKDFGDGQFIQEIEIAKDELFFDVVDINYTEKLKNFDKLIEEYANDTIGDKAIYEKSKLLVEHEKYKDALELEADLLKLDNENFPNVSKIITDAAIGTMKQALKAKECNSVLAISSQYKIELSDEWDDGVYECAMKGADFELAKKMADRNIKSKDIQHRKKWLYRYIKVDFATGNYSNVIEASKDLILLIKDDENSEYLDVYRYIFDTYQRVEDSIKMINAIIDIEKIYGLDYLDIERYIAVMSIGSDKKDNNLVINYAKKIMDIQASSDSYAQSPFVEFALYQAYIEKEENNKALDIIKLLDDRELSNVNRSRQKYLLGSVYSKLWMDDEAQKAYQESIDADKDSAWAKLAKGAKGI